MNRILALARHLFISYRQRNLSIGFAMAIGLSPMFAMAQDRVDAFSYDWSPASATLRGAVEDEFPIAPLTFASGLTIERTALPFYRSTDLVRVTGGWEPVNLHLYFLAPRGGELVRLNGTSPPIHAFNASHPVILTEDTVREYLWFFTFFVRGEHGPFLLAEFEIDPYTPSIDSMTQTQAQTYLSALGPADCDPSGASFTCDATIMYSNALFEASLTLHPSGMVEMQGDQPILADLPVQVNAPIDPSQVEGQVRMVQVGGGLGGVMNTPRLAGTNRSTMQSLIDGNIVPINRATTPFLAGISQAIFLRCSSAIAAGDRQRLRQFATDNLTTAMLGSDFSAENLLDGMANHTGSMLAAALGQSIGEQLACSRAEAGAIAAVIVRSLRENESSSRFINSCTLGSSECMCLARMGTGVIPDLNSRMYSGSLVREIIERNPFLGLQIAFTCGISNY